MNKMQKKSKATLLSVVTIALVLVCGLSFAGVVYMNSRLSSQMDYIVHAENFGSASGYLTEQVRSYAATGDTAYYDNYWYEVNTAKTRENSVAALQALGLEQAETDLINHVYDISDSLIPLEEQAMGYVQAGDLDAAIAILYGADYVAGVNEVTGTLGSLSATIQNRLEMEQSRLQTIVNVLTVLAAVSILATLTAQAVVVRFVMNELITPILRIQHRIGTLAQGDLRSSLALEEDNTEVGQTVHSIKEFLDSQKDLIADIDEQLSEMAGGNFNTDTRHEQSYRGDYANILASLRKINHTLNSTLGRIHDVSDRVSTGAAQISTGSQSLAQSTTEQAGSVETLSATIIEISNNIAQTAEDSQAANDQAMEASSKVSDCNRQMHDMIGAMNRINQASTEISKVIKVIEDIAFQTNILALNAAVEAARAGEAGKGFAVVANEVRTLAGKSAEASKSTSLLITNSQDAVKHGMELANETAAALEEVVSLTQQSANAFTKIATAAESEKDAIQQVTQGVEQISLVVQTNSATSEESAATSEELASQAEIMNELLAYFKLKQ